MSLEFTPGSFQDFRVVSNIHFGEKSLDIVEGSTVQFDGNTLKVNGVEHMIGGSVRAALKAKWLVPVSDTTTKYRAQPANVSMHSATNPKDDKFLSTVVEPDEVNKGKIASVRNRGDGIVRKTTQAEELDGGVVIGKLSSPIMKSQLDDRNAQTLIAQSENSKVKVVKVGSQEGRVTPSATVGSVVDVEGQEGVVISVMKPSAQKAEEERAKRLQSLPPPTVAAPTPATVVTAPSESAEAQAKLALVRMAIPGFQWDLTRQWKARVKDAVENHGKNPLFLNGILAVESDTVKAHIMKLLKM